MEHIPLSKAAEIEAVRALNLRPGMQLKITWRTKETDIFSPGEWTESVVTVEDGGKDAASFPTIFVLENEVFESRPPLDEGHEVCSLEVQKCAPRPFGETFAKKRSREPQITSEAFAHTLAEASAVAMIDAKRGKTTIALAEGLRVPKEIPDSLRCLYPHLWCISVEKEAREDKAREWSQALTGLQQYFGVVCSNPQRRDALALAIDNVIAGVYRYVPASKQQWRFAFGNVRAALRELVTVAYGAREAEDFDRKVGEALAEGLVDFVNLIASISDDGCQAIVARNGN